MTPIDLPTLLSDRGLLTEREAAVLLAGGPIRGSWWGHPESRAIYAALGRLTAHPDARVLKLVAGKQTYVHRRLWPAVVRAQRERALWPAVSAAAARLLARIEREGRVAATGEPRRELERALLAVGEEEHTPGGAHQVVLAPFDSWIPAEVARAAAALSLEAALGELARAGFVPARRLARPRPPAVTP